MRYLRLPPNVASVAAGGRQYEADKRGYVAVEDANDANEIMSHDGRIEVVSEDEFNGEKRQEPVDQKSQPAGDMKRSELFAALKAMGVSATATLSTPQLREIFNNEKAKRDAANQDIVDADKRAAALREDNAASSTSKDMKTADPSKAPENGGATFTAPTAEEAAAAGRPPGSVLGDQIAEQNRAALEEPTEHELGGKAANEGGAKEAKPGATITAPPPVEPKLPPQGEQEQEGGPKK